MTTRKVLGALAIAAAAATAEAQHAVPRHAPTYVPPTISQARTPIPNGIPMQYRNGVHYRNNRHFELYFGFNFGGFVADAYYFNGFMYPFGCGPFGLYNRDQLVYLQMMNEARFGPTIGMQRQMAMGNFPRHPPQFDQPEKDVEMEIAKMKDQMEEMERRLEKPQIHINQQIINMGPTDPAPKLPPYTSHWRDGQKIPCEEQRQGEISNYLQFKITTDPKFAGYTAVTKTSIIDYKGHDLAPDVTLFDPHGAWVASFELTNPYPDNLRDVKIQTVVLGYHNDNPDDHRLNVIPKNLETGDELRSYVDSALAKLVK